MAGKNVAVKKVGSKALTNWKEQLKALAKEESDRTPASQSNIISLDKKGNFNQGGASLGKEINVVILDHVFLKEYFDSEFDKDNPSSPACALVSRTGKNLAPDAKSPNQQAKICAECEMNEFGSAKGGTRKGKACGDKRLIAVIMADELETESPEIYFMKLSVTTGPNFNKHVKKINDTMEVPCWGVVTQMESDTTVDWEKAKFEIVDRVGENHFEKLLELVEVAKKQLDQPPDFSKYREPSKKATKSKGKSRLS